jgi:FMN-dependent NADH-azoreductase
MKRLLHIAASARGDESYSERTAQAFIDAWHAGNPDGTVDTLHLHKEPLPTFGAHASAGKYAVMRGEQPTNDAKLAWDAVVAVIDRVKAADVLVFSVPMWNFGIPYVLKHLIDIIVQPGYTFTVDDKGYHGLLTTKRAFVAYARGGVYDAASGAAAMDHQKPYLDMMLGFIGIPSTVSVVVGPTMAGREAGAKTLEAAIERAKAAARDF